MHVAIYRVTAELPESHLAPKNGENVTRNEHVNDSSTSHVGSTHSKSRPAVAYVD